MEDLRIGVFLGWIGVLDWNVRGLEDWSVGKLECWRVGLESYRIEVMKVLKVGGLESCRIGVIEN